MKEEKHGLIQGCNRDESCLEGGRRAVGGYGLGGWGTPALHAPLMALRCPCIPLRLYTPNETSSPFQFYVEPTWCLTELGRGLIKLRHHWQLSPTLGTHTAVFPSHQCLHHSAISSSFPPFSLALALYFVIRDITSLFPARYKFYTIIQKLQKNILLQSTDPTDVL